MHLPDLHRVSPNPRMCRRLRSKITTRPFHWTVSPQNFNAVKQELKDLRLARELSLKRGVVLVVVLAPPHCKSSCSDLDDALALMNFSSTRHFPHVVTCHRTIDATPNKAYTKNVDSGHPAIGATITPLPTAATIANGCGEITQALL